MKRYRHYLACLAALCAAAAGARAAELQRVIATVKPSVVAVGTYQKGRNPPVVFNGTGFAIGDGLSIITNAHVVFDPTAPPSRKLGIITGSGREFEFRAAKQVQLDKDHDLAHLRIGGTPLPPLVLADSDSAAEGQAFAFTGYPLGMKLGMNAVTHRAMLSSVTPAMLPAIDARSLDRRGAAQLSRQPFPIFQLDGTAYPGNSGSPLYRPDDGSVIGIVNMVWIKERKEMSAVTTPSGISYAIPSNYIRELVDAYNAAQAQERTDR